MRPALADQRLDRLLVDVVLELVRLDVDLHDLVDAGNARVDARRLAGDDGERDRPLELLRGRNQLAGHVPQLPAQLLRNDEDTHRSRSRTISPIRWAISAGPPCRISAPSPLGGESMLGLLDRAQRRVPGLVDPRLDRQQRRQVDLDDVDEPALQLAVDRRAAVPQLDLRHDRDPRQPEQLGQRGAGGRLHRVARLNAAEDEARLLPLHGLGERVRDGEGVLEAAGHADGPIGTHGETAAQRRFRLALAGRDGDDFALPEPLADLERFLGCGRIPLVQRVVDVVGIDVPLVGGELDFVAEDGDLLDADDYLQTATGSRLITARSRMNGFGTSGFSESISLASRWPSKMQSATSRGATQSPIR